MPPRITVFRTPDASGGIRKTKRNHLHSPVSEGRPDEVRLARCAPRLINRPQDRDRSFKLLNVITSISVNNFFIGFPSKTFPHIQHFVCYLLIAKTIIRCVNGSARDAIDPTVSSICFFKIEPRLTT
uniref:Uncharacterized protein n=1 Tax=Sipha flava TaxID=143950 RepID=A0A2S2QGK6_9HEMI